MKRLWYILPLLFILSCEEENSTICDANITWKEFYFSSFNVDWVGVKATIKNIGDKNITRIKYRWKVTFTDYTTRYIYLNTSLIDLPSNKNYNFETTSGDAVRIYDKIVESVK